MGKRISFKKRIGLNDLIKKVNKSYISSIKEVVLQLITVINNPRSGAKDLKKIIEKDPPLTAELLRLANSAYYGFEREISEIQEAIVAIGFNTVKKLALTQKVCEIFKKEGDFEGYSRIGLWKHSVAVAFCNKLTYMREFRKPGENIFTAGLLHNLGIIVEDQFLHNMFKNVLVTAKEDKCNLIQAEKSIFGFNHADIGKAITQNWNFPDELVWAIGKHHEPEKVNDKYKRITLTSYVSDYICQRNDIGYSDAPDKNHSLYTKCLKELHIKKEAMNLIIEDVSEEILKMEKGGWFNEKG